MRYYIIAGEVSGDLHASALIKCMKQQDAHAEFRAWGGDNMQAEGATIIKHIKDLAFMGFVEVVKNLRTILGNLSFCKKDIEAYKPDAIIFIDYPGFNLRIAAWAKEQGYKTIYYISPQIWAWKENRVHQIKRDIDLMMCILPFEKEFYKRHNHPVSFVGHPLIQRIAQYKANHTPRVLNKKIIALLPGSRLQEIQTKLPIMLSVVQKFPAYQFIVAQSPNLAVEHYTPFIKHFSNVSLVQNATYDILLHAHAALVTSGTATLEAALFKVPQVVCYKGNSLSYLIAKQLIKVFLW
jgi:lipid-A-disaccharide synthase